MTQEGDSAPDLDAALLAAHVQGSTTAFGEIVQRHQNRMWAVALRMMRDPDDAADVVQDAMVKAFRRADTFRGQARVSTWLHRIVVTTALDALRASSRQAAATGDPADRADVHDSISQRETEVDVSEALSHLTDDQRAAVVLVDMAGFTVQEAAWALQCPEGTVKSRCFRARAHLAELLAGYGTGRAARLRNQPDIGVVQPSESSSQSRADGSERTEGQA